ncbi:MAG: hypothetical protein NUV96_02150 [Candidatus Colwellbacteria bacterium]|nr:hypothetical protein [Candidatus Colwellbacteria bacterium]
MSIDLASKRAVFKKYDIRGVYPEMVNEDLVYAVVKGLGKKVFKKGKVVLGRDVRNSSPSLYESAKKALSEIGEIEIEDVGIMTTPMLAFLINHIGASGGVMITASHNPREDNGIKAAGANGEVISGEEMYQLI